MSETKKLIDEYSEDYCLYLEATYDADMLSEGGHAAIEKMFVGTELQQKKLLDIGSGLGGVAFYLAEHYQAYVTGLELGSWMVNQAQLRIPNHLKHQVDFIAYDPPKLPFPDASFDVVYSKGVLTHVKDKLPLFQEVFRILKPEGYFVIDDWLSPTDGRWGKRLQKMCEMENLTLYAQTENTYRQILQECGFCAIQMRSENSNYAQYNQDIIDRLQRPDIAEPFIARFGEAHLTQAIECYELIRDSIKDNELLIRWIKSQKPKK